MASSAATVAGIGRGRVDAAVLAVAGAGLAIVLYAGALVAGAASASASVHADDVVWFAAWLVCAISGGVLARSLAGRRYGALLLGIGLVAEFGLACGVAGRVLLASSDAAATGAGLMIARTVLTDVPQVALLGFGLLLFPDGRLPARSRWWRSAACVGAVVLTLFVLADLVRPGRLDDDVRTPNPIGISRLRGLIAGVETAALGILVVLLVVGLVAVVQRWRRGNDTDRRAIAVFAGAGMWLVVSVVTEAVVTAIAGVDVSLLGAIGEAIAICALPVAALTSTLRRDLFDAQVVLNRNLTYVIVTVIVVAGYAGTVTLLGSLFDTRSAFGTSLLVTGVIAVVFGPLRESVQGGVEHVLLGRRSPYAALSTLGRRIDASLSGDVALATAVETVAETFRLPYVELRVEIDDESRVVAAQGRPAPIGASLTLVHQGRTLGALDLAPRSPHERLTSRDLQLLNEFATRIAGTVETVRLTEQLRHSRAAVVRAREEERRRIRRELHDGIGPMLASTALAVQRVEGRLNDDDAKRAALTQARTEVQQTIDDIRRIVHGLGPATLDDLGLVAAVRQRAAALSGDVRIEVADDNIGDLDAAVEVAAYLLVTEAMTNVVRHANATTCSVDLVVSGDVLRVHIRDDGSGLHGSDAVGIGMTSMRERAAELSGRATITSTEHGTTVQAWLPIT